MAEHPAASPPHTIEIDDAEQTHRGTYRVEGGKITVWWSNESSTTRIGFSDPAAVARTMLLNLVAKRRRTGGHGPPKLTTRWSK
jgi:hypothetical protein